MLEVNNLTVSYGEIKAVNNISFNVKESEIVAIIGNNGAGKTSTLKALAGVIAPKSGSIKLFGEQIKGLKAYNISSGRSWNICTDDGFRES